MSVWSEKARKIAMSERDGYSIDKDGNKYDHHIHGPILDNDEASRQLAEDAIKAAKERGVLHDYAVDLYRHRGKKPEVAKMLTVFKAEALSDEWWKKLTRKQQQAYIKAHPGSKYARRVSAPVANKSATPAKKTGEALTADAFITPSDKIQLKLLGKSRLPVAMKKWKNIFGNVHPEKIADDLTEGLPKTRIEVLHRTGDRISLNFNNPDFIAERVFTKTKAGIVVYHKRFKVKTPAQGHGIAKQFLRNSMRLYKKMGVAKIDTIANINIGAYAWAKYGFMPTDWSACSKRIARRLYYLEKQSNINKTDAAHVRMLLNSKDPHTLWHIADLNKPIKHKSGTPKGLFWNGPSTMPLGKLLLFDTDYIAELKLNDRQAMKRFDAYVGKLR